MSGRSSSEAAVAEDETYTIREYDSSDREGVHALAELVWGGDRSPEWFAHRYEANPYTNGPPMIVAEADGDVVGARPFTPLPMRVGGRDLTVVYLGNLMVHPEHRRRGLFTRMTELATEAYTDTESALFFNFANEMSAPGYRKFDFQAVGTGPVKQYRVQRPAQVAQERTRLPVERTIGALADGAMDRYLSLRRGPTSTEYDVERRSGIPANLLADLYEADHPTALHTRREETLYRWLANAPHREYETYVASKDGTPTAAAVLRDRSQRRDDDLCVADVVPPCSTARRDAIEAVLDSVVSDYRDARVVALLGPVVNEHLLPEETLAKFGFLSSTNPLLARFVAKGNTLFATPLDGTKQLPTVGGVDLGDPENWAVRVR
ncbi:GNAT family N-acetyltransferase [Halobacterium wangiae]|uniref:GNAT family N-acetyltransferase n=1 Tax=Halobacterium wangiae TaxID=2902623 RepID=UPI001E5C6E1E|nr:GNAT family N-acetyltransferase [Halobacterium wangiae]